MNHLIFALNHSMDLKKDGIDPMIPFAIVARGGNVTIKAYVGDTPDYADKMYEKTIQEEDPDFVVYATDSYLTSEGIKYDAVLLKAYDRNDTEIYLVGQKFRPKTDYEEFKQIGNPGFLGTTENSFLYSGNSQNISDGIKAKKPWWKFR